MSNIGFIENCANYIQQIFTEALTPPPISKNGKKGRCRIISQAEKESYIKLIRQIKEMERYNEIEDMDRYKKALKIILDCDLTNITKIKKRITKGA